MSQDTPLKINTPAHPITVFCNGSSVDPKTPPQGITGKNRIVMILKTTDQRAVWCVFPLWLKIKPTAGELTYRPVLVAQQQ